MLITCLSWSDQTVGSVQEEIVSPMSISCPLSWKIQVRRDDAYNVCGTPANNFPLERKLPNYTYTSYVPVLLIRYTLLRVGVAKLADKLTDTAQQTETSQANDSGHNRVHRAHSYIHRHKWRHMDRGCA